MDSIPAKSIADWTNRTILIGEDELVNFKLLEMILVKTRVSILHGHTGAEVVDIFRKNPQVSLILMDIKMPVMDGVEATLEIRKLNKEVPIIAQTAYAFEDEENKCYMAGFSGYITKPINRNLLLSMIQSFFI